MHRSLGTPYTKQFASLLLQREFVACYNARIASVSSFVQAQPCSVVYFAIVANDYELYF